MRVIVCGGRNYADSHAVLAALEPYAVPGATIIHGGASGADALANDAALLLGIPLEVWPADWREQGKGAGPRRNQRMVDAGADCVLAFAGGRGTADCCRRARAAGIPVIHHG